MNLTNAHRVALDSSAMIAYLSGEPGDEVVRGLLSDGSTICTAHAVNLCEVYYDSLRVGGVAYADDVLRDLKADGLQFAEATPEDMFREAARLKVAHRIALGDCFGLAFALTTGATFVTSDHKEFDPITALYPIQFIR